MEVWCTSKNSNRGDWLSQEEKWLCLSWHNKKPQTEKLMPSVLLPGLSEQIKLVCCPLAVQTVFRSSKLFAACQIVEPEDEEEVGPTSSPGYSSTLRWSLVQVKNHTPKDEERHGIQSSLQGLCRFTLGKWAGPYMHVRNWSNTRWQDPN